MHQEATQRKYSILASFLRLVAGFPQLTFKKIWKYEFEKNADEHYNSSKLGLWERNIMS